MEGLPQQNHAPEPEPAPKKQGLLEKTLAAFGIFDQDTRYHAERARQKIVAEKGLDFETPLREVVAQEYSHDPEVKGKGFDVVTKPEEPIVPPAPKLVPKPRKKANPDIIPFAKRAPGKDEPERRKAA